VGRHPFRESKGCGREENTEPEWAGFSGSYRRQRGNREGKVRNTQQKRQSPKNLIITEKDDILQVI